MISEDIFKTKQSLNLLRYLVQDVLCCICLNATKDKKMKVLLSTLLLVVLKLVNV